MKKLDEQKLNVQKILKNKKNLNKKQKQKFLRLSNLSVPYVKC